MRKLLDILPMLLEIAPKEPELYKAVVKSAWKASAGPQVTANAVVTALDDKILKIAVRDENWKKELGSLSPQLIRKINSVLGTRAIERIEHYVDSSVRFVRYAFDRNDREASEPENPPEHLQKAAELIKDGELRDVFLNAAAESLRYKAKYGR
ncbi:MAG TPA: DciA family protein [Pyrinomonadaceae bacterium]|nr:DciA family protein [Pyrinomonadaceae bacterium]HMP65110.1 DciA family protein [Pyrinomonadaceae bacterium]